MVVFTSVTTDPNSISWSTVAYHVTPQTLTGTILTGVFNVGSWW